MNSLYISSLCGAISFVDLHTVSSISQEKRKTRVTKNQWRYLNGCFTTKLTEPQIANFGFPIIILMTDLQWNKSRFIGENNWMLESKFPPFSLIQSNIWFRNRFGMHMNSAAAEKATIVIMQNYYYRLVATQIKSQSGATLLCETKKTTYRNGI